MKNPKTDRGLYLNIKDEDRSVFFAPDYERLIILNSKNNLKLAFGTFRIEFSTGEKRK
nr:hypothetical protein [uncultured Chryseobacterium sp.]